MCRVQSVRPENLCVSKSYPDLLALYPRYFAKIDHGEVFPEQPYPASTTPRPGNPALVPVHTYRAYRSRSHSHSSSSINGNRRWVCTTPPCPTSCRWDKHSRLRKASRVVESSLAVGIPPRRQPVRASSCCLPSVLRLLWRTAAVAEGTHRALRLARPSTATDALGRHPLHLVSVPLFGESAMRVVYSHTVIIVCARFRLWLCSGSFFPRNHEWWLVLCGVDNVNSAQGKTPKCRTPLLPLSLYRQVRRRRRKRPTNRADADDTQPAAA